MNEYRAALQKYAEFNGRASRRDFWMFVLVNTVIIIVLSIIDGIIGTSTGGFGFLSGLYSLGVLVPSIAIGVRRLHDTNKTGWLLLIGLIPFGGLVLLVFYVAAGDPADNKYGPVPVPPATGMA